MDTVSKIEKFSFAPRKSTVYNFTQPVATIISEPSLRETYVGNKRNVPALSHYHRKAFKILRELRNDLHARHPHLKLPNAWVLRCLVQSHLQERNDQGWSTTITHLLQHLLQSCQKQNTFVDSDTKKPLFPTAEGFEMADLKGFLIHCLALLNHQA